MLTSLRIKGYRALRDLQLDLPVGVPLVLIGENATGKSSILDAFSLLRAVASGRIGAEIYDRGGWEAVAWRGASPTITLTARFANTPPFDQDGGPVEYTVTLGLTRPVFSVVSEEVRVYHHGLDRPPFNALTGGAQPRVANVQVRGQFDPAAPAEPDSHVGTNAVLPTVVDAARYPTVVRVKEALQSLTVYPSFALNTRLGGRQVELTRRIQRSGHDLLNALHSLSQQHAARWTALLADLTAVFPWCESLRFPPGPGRGLIDLTWTDRRSGAALYLDDMSEGMRVYLALLAALLAADSPGLLAFDEPERSLHPHALRRLVKVIESRAEQTPLLVATHSDRLLDYLEDPAAALRITRISPERGVYLEALDADLLRAWLSEYTLSELRARERLDPPRDPEEGLS